MAVPTISSVTPATGHTGGRTLVEVIGTGFALPPAPPASGPTTAPLPSVRVTFGGKPATEVLVFSATELHCLTPIQDELWLEQSFAAAEGSAALSLAAHGLANGTAVRVRASGGELPEELDPRRAYFVVGAAAGTIGLATTAGGVALVMSSAATVLVRRPGAHDVAVQNLDADGEDVPGESATLAAAYTFRRPDLGQLSDFSRTIRAFIAELRRQVLENVSETTHVDWDPETGDETSYAAVQHLPAIVLLDRQVTENRRRPRTKDVEIAAAGNRFVRKRAPKVVDVTWSLVGVSDDEDELNNLFAVVAAFFDKNATLAVRRDPADASKGDALYEIGWSFGAATSTWQTEGGAGVRSFQGQVALRGVLLEAMPGTSQAGLPGMPAGQHENVRAYGYTSEDVVLDVQEVPED